jgi:hypothetical protein
MFYDIHHFISKVIMYKMKNYALIFNFKMLIIEVLFDKLYRYQIKIIDLVTFATSGL